jgi:lactoylglutathione lyase
VSVAGTVAVYERAEFAQHSQLPPEGGPGTLRCAHDEADVGIVHESSPQRLVGRTIGDGPRFELFVYVDDVDASLATLRSAGVTVLREAEDMPWGERVAFVTDPEGNPVTLAAPTR